MLPFFFEMRKGNFCSVSIPCPIDQLKKVYNFVSNKLKIENILDINLRELMLQ